MIYDSAGRVMTERVVSAWGQSTAMTFGYDSSGRVASLTGIADDLTVFTNAYTYDALSRVTSITQSGPVANDKHVTFTYDKLNRFDTISRYQNDDATADLVLTTDYTFDDSGRLTGLTHRDPTTGLLVSHAYNFDAASMIESYTNSLDGTITYTHDASGQLTAADHPGLGDDESYTYDSMGNRTAANGDTYGVSTGNRMTTDGTYHYEYDNEGHRTDRYVWTDTDSDGEVDANEKSLITTYAWDHRGRLIEVTTPDNIVNFEYDHLNRLISKRVDENSDGDTLDPEDHEEYFAHALGQIVMRFDGYNDVDLTNVYLWGPSVDQILADEQFSGDGINTPTSDCILWPLADHLGTVRDLAEYDTQTDTTEIIHHRIYDSFGNITEIQELDQNGDLTPLADPSQAAIDHLFAFTGRMLEKETGLQNNLHRWYDPLTSKWLSEDPISFAGGDANLARYVGNASVLFSDPNGLQNPVDTRDQLDREIIERNKSGIDIPIDPRQGMSNFQRKQHYHLTPPSVRLKRSFQVRERAQIAAAVYADGPDKTGYWVQDRIFTVSGFRAILYRHLVEDRYALAFAGTGGHFYADMESNVTQGVGLKSPQYKQAIGVTGIVKARHANLELVGHSLGGGLATASALVHNLPATVFNPSGVHEKTLERNNADFSKVNTLVQVYRVKGEFLSVIQHTAPVSNILMPDAKGNTYIMNPAQVDCDRVARGNTWIGGMISVPSTSIGMHGIQGVLRALSEDKGLNQP